ncbi:MAG TPA: GNAT family N-acetyltransferase [Phormidium sp.]
MPKQKVKIIRQEVPLPKNLSASIENRLKLLQCRIEDFCVISQNSNWYFKNSWIKQSGIASLYLRRSIRLIPELTDSAVDYSLLQSKMSCTLDIAAIQVEPAYQRKGIGSYLVNLCHEIHPQRVTYVESVHNPILASWLERNGWKTQEDIRSCYYKIKEIEVL